MNNYSWLQQKLHQFSLSSQFMREVTFDVESSFISSVSESDEHVFVAGLARSGTTILLNSIYESGLFASLSYADMPFILAPNLWSKLAFNKKDTSLLERAHGDGIKVSLESPEAFEEVFWKTFSETKSDSLKKFETYVNLVNHSYRKKRYLSKNNQNIRRLELISNIFPNSKILIPFRDPIQHAFSLLTQHKKFIEDARKDKFISNYMRWTGHTEFGPNYRPIHNKNLTFKDDLDINHWVEQWYLTYRGCLNTLQNKQIGAFVCYEKLCGSKNYWREILQKLDVQTTYDVSFKESRKEVSAVVDDELIEKSSFLYYQLDSL